MSAIVFMILVFGFAVMLTELITELVVKSEIFKPVRSWLQGDEEAWLGRLLKCGYCFSVWAAFLSVTLCGAAVPITSHFWLNWVLTSLVVHRLSNVWHNIIDKYTDKYYDMRYVNSERE